MYMYTQDKCYNR